MKINIKGVIVSDDEKKVYQWCGIPATSPNDINEAIEKASLNEELEVVINSGGGSVFAGSEIYTNLRDYSGNVVTKIVGIAASAASVIAMAGDKVVMSPTAQIMIHNASTEGYGNHKAFGKTVDFLKRTDGTIANAYVAKTGKNKNEIMALMDRTTWMDAKEAKENRFVDEIMFDEEIKAIASVDINNQILPREVIDKVLNQLSQEKKKTDSPLNSGSEIVSTLKNEDKQEDKMTKEELKTSYPGLYNEIYEEGVANERLRIQELDNIKTPGAENLVTEAKYKTFETKAEIAVKIVDGIGIASIEATKPVNAEIIQKKEITMSEELSNKLNDAKGSGIEEITAGISETEEEKKQAKSKSLAERIANQLNKKRGGSN